MIVNNFYIDNNKLEQYAKENKVPIINKEGLEFLIDFINKNKINNILEIGSAIGYSAINMALNSKFVFTIERNDNMFIELKKNIQNTKLTNIKYLHCDALYAFDYVKDYKFDMIFIDAAKASYTQFFKIYENLLNPGGYIICDNLSFHNLIDEDISTMTRGLRGIIKKLREFKKFIYSNENYKTEVYNIGDGISVSRRIK